MGWRPSTPGDVYRSGGWSCRCGTQRLRGRSGGRRKMEFDTKVTKENTKTTKTSALLLVGLVSLAVAL